MHPKHTNDWSCLLLLRFGVLVLVIQLLFLCGNNNNNGQVITVVSASVIGTGAAAAAGAGAVTTAAAKVTRKAVVTASSHSSGFRHFSQRAAATTTTTTTTAAAARWQSPFQKSSSVFLDLITNNNNNNNNNNKNTLTSATDTNSNRNRNRNRNRNSNRNSNTAATAETVPSRPQLPRPLLPRPLPLLSLSPQEHHPPPATATAPVQSLVLRNVNRIVKSTITDAVAGFCSGYTLAASLAIGKRLYSWTVMMPPTSTPTNPVSITTATAATAATTTTTTTTTLSACKSPLMILPYPDLRRFSTETMHLHTKSKQFGIEWAKMSAVFCACRLLVSVIRLQQQKHHYAFVVDNTYCNTNTNTNEEWDTVLGSGLAGAVFAILVPSAPAPAPAGTSMMMMMKMTRSAVLYGGIMWMMHPRLWNETKNNIQQFVIPYDS